DRAAAHSGAQGGGREFGAGGRTAGAPAGGGRAGGGGAGVRLPPGPWGRGGGRGGRGGGGRRGGGGGAGAAAGRAGGGGGAGEPGVLAGIPGDGAIGLGAALARRKGLTIAMVRRMNEVYPRAISLAARGGGGPRFGGDQPVRPRRGPGGVHRGGPAHRA